MLNTPVLFIVFNRPDTTQQVFEAIRKASPRQLFVASDGPRNDKMGESVIVENVRKIATAVDWECEVKTLFRKENVGCGRGPAEAITWFFENVDQGIILEDDCLPHHSFFEYCENLLNYYKDDERIMLISGTNLFKEWNADKQPYFFSKYAGIWGWASWKRAWQTFDYDIKKWGNPFSQNLVKGSFLTHSERDYYTKIFQNTYQKMDVSWWDYQWYFARIINSGMGVVPSVNLISNIGFGENATHTFHPESVISCIPVKPMSFPLKHNNDVIDDIYYKIEVLKLMGIFDDPKIIKRNIFSSIKHRVKTILKRFFNR